MKGIAEIVGALGVIITMVATAIWQFAQLDNRVSKLEAQVQVLAVAPTASASGISDGANPLQQACANLADRAAQGIADGRTLTVGDPIRDMMKDLGCSANGAPAPQDISN